MLLLWTLTSFSKDGIKRAELWENSDMDGKKESFGKDQSPEQWDLRIPAMAETVQTLAFLVLISSQTHAATPTLDGHQVQMKRQRCLYGSRSPCPSVLPLLR